MKQLTDEVFAQVREAFVKAEDCIQAMTDGPHRGDWGAALDVLEKALAALDTAQPEPVNAMLVEALQAAEKLEHEALVALSEATYELKVGNTYTTATDTYKSNNDLIHRLDKILNSQYRDRKRTALTAAKQAQPVCKCTFAQKTVGDGCAVCNPKLAAELSQPERAPLSDSEIEQEFCNITGLETGINPAAADTKRALVWFKKGYAHAIKQGGQHD